MALETDESDIEDSVTHRFERKFTTCAPFREVLQVIQGNSAQFREIYQERHINNIYFDDSDLSNYFANEDGIQDRLKTRVRWYGSLQGHVEKPTLEIKIKRGWAGEKPSYRMAPFDMDSRFGVAVARDLMKRSKLPAWVRARVDNEVPTLLNRYSRRYFLSADGECRLTVDRDLRFFRCPPGAFVPRRYLPRAQLVIELKYLCRDTLGVDLCANDLRFRMTKFSKYATGIRMLYGYA